MAGIRTVNLLWERRLRGVYPVAPFALRDDGALNVAVPRPLEPRAYDLTCLALDGAAEVLTGFAVETLLKLEVPTSGNNCLGMTADDIYLFHGGEKQRFLGERHVLYIDAALSGDGLHLATVFSDRAGASFVLAYGGIDGHVAWLRDMDLPLTAVAVSRAGNRIAAGMEAGLIQLFDASRRDVWEFGQPEPIRALVCSQDGVYVAYGTSQGGVGLVDGHGTRRWEVRLPGEIRALALSGDGSLCAALCSPADNPNTTRLYCLEQTGRIGWEYDAEQLLLGLSVSASGRYIATTTRNGTLAVYEVIPGEQADYGAIQALSGASARAESLAKAGDLPGACGVLRDALAADPGAVAIYERLADLQEVIKRDVLRRSESYAAAGDHADAVTMLETAWQDAPCDPDLVAARARARRQRAEQLLAAARELPAEDPTVEAALLAVLAVDPSLMAARQELGALRARRVKRADEAAAAMLAADRVEDAVVALESAQVLLPTHERAARLERAHISMEVTAGMVAYNEKRYQEAIFQFKKALHRDPAHVEAKRYLAFAQRFVQDAANSGSNDSLNDRFSRLE
jgi:tetratricopeptide (TPR) repeat protein